MNLFSPRWMEFGDFLMTVGIAFIAGALASAWLCESFRDKYEEDKNEG